MKHLKFHFSLILLFCFLAPSAKCQKPYDIEIIFSGDDVRKATIGALVSEYFWTIPLKKDSSNVIAQQISLSSKYPIIEISYFSPKHAPSFHRFFLTSQQCKLVVYFDKDTDMVSVTKTSGVTSFENAGQKEFNLFAKTEKETLAAYSKAYNNDISAYDSSVKNKYIRDIEAIKDKAAQFVRQQPNYLYSSYLFMDQILGDPRYSNDVQLELYTKILNQRHIDSFEENFILNKLDKDRLAVNTAAPLQNKVFKDLQGSSYSISSLGKKLVIVNIWSTSCVPCIEEIPRLKELYAKYKALMEIVSFSTDTEEQKVRDFIKAKNIDWITVANQPEICRIFGSDKGIPQVFLLNEKGVIIYSRSANADPSLDILEKTLAFHAEKEKTKQQ
jgi:thiol-disulfide isomerase/thioredoxin